MKLLKDILTIIKRKIKGRNFLKNVLLLAGGTAMAQIISVIASPIITRLYTPADMGILSVYSSSLGILSAFVTLRYDYAVPIADNDENAINVFALSLTSVLIISIITMFFTITFSKSFTKILNSEPLEPYLWLLPIGLLAVGSYRSIMHWAIRKKEFKVITKTKINQGITKSSIQIILGFLSAGPFGLILGNISGESAGVGTLSKTLLRKDFKLLKKVKLSTMKEMAIRFKKFPLISSVYGLIDLTPLAHRKLTPYPGAK